MRQNEEIWRKLKYFQSADTAQKFLQKKYAHIHEADAKHYDNCYPFMYYLEQGEILFKQAISSPLSIKPVLLFYGMIHFVKACILTVDPHYPSSTAVLAHGVTSRKRKKRNYHFSNDEVKIQKNGLCTHFTHRLFQMRNLEGEKFKMGDLLFLIPELDDAYQFIHEKANMISLEEENSYWKIPVEVEYAYFMGKSRLKSYLTGKVSKAIHWNDEILGELAIDKKTEIFPPFRFHLWKEKVCLPAKLTAFNQLPDLLIYYVLMYNLSMISRYETEWWMELIKNTPNEDHPFIITFLAIAEEKIPFLTLQILSR